MENTTSIDIMFTVLFERNPDFTIEHDKVLASDICYFFCREGALEYYRNDDKIHYNNKFELAEYFLMESTKLVVTNYKIINFVKEVLNKNTKDREKIFSAMVLKRQLNYQDDNDIKKKIQDIFGKHIYQIACNALDSLEDEKINLEFKSKPTKFIHIGTVIGNAFYEIMQRSKGEIKTLRMHDILDYAEQIEKNYRLSQEKVLIEVDYEKLISFFHDYRNYFNYDPKTKLVRVKENVTAQHLSNQFRWNLSDNMLRKLSDNNAVEILMPKLDKEEACK